jgi:hypothetical protein
MTLTSVLVKARLTGVDRAVSPAQFDREVLAMMLGTNLQLVADVLLAEEHSRGHVMRAIAATRSLDMVVEDTLRALVDQARAAGHTWAEIGGLLGVTRQAAFQRFGGRSATSADGEMVAPVEGAVEHAVAVLQAFLDGRFDDVRSRFDERMLDACSGELLADVREKVDREAGEVQALGAPVVSVRDGYTVVDIPVALDRADGIGRVVLDAERQVAGFFVRPAEVVS